MKMSQGVEWGLHACLHLAWAEGRSVPAPRLAEVHDLSPTSLNKHLQQLVRAGIVRSTPGPAGGFSLGRPLEEITVLDVVEAIEGTAGAFRCTEIRQRGPLAAGRPTPIDPCAIASTMGRAEAAWRAVLASMTLADLSGQVASDPPEVPVAVGALLER